MKNYRTGAKGALLDEYERAILDLHQVINDVSDEELVTIVDTQTSNPDCISIQTVLTHVVNSGFGYAVYIKKLRGVAIDFGTKTPRNSVAAYQNDLTAFFNYTVETFDSIADDELEELDNSKKIITRWGQFFDIDQMMEHAIVHILRHRRQIEKFKIFLLHR